MEGQIGIKHSALIRNEVKEIWSYPVQTINAVNSLPCECRPMSSLLKNRPMSSLKNIFLLNMSVELMKCVLVLPLPP
jgi:hypothetical protein